MTVERLQKILARAGIASRRASEEIIQQGRVTVNGAVATLGASADPDTDDIRLDGERLRLPESHDYIMLNKPKGVISDEDVSGEHDNARDLIPMGGYLYPVGRLDLDSEGLMLFTNDGELAHKLTHPRYEHPKTYRVLVEGAPAEEVLNQWRDGVWIEGRRTYPAEVHRIIKTRQGTILEVTLREGRKRQIRRVAAQLGHPVLSLVRTGLGPLTLGDLPVGAWRRLTEGEVASLHEVRKTRPRVRRAPAGQPGARRPRREDDRPQRGGRATGRRSEEGRQRGERQPRYEGSSASERRDRPGRDDRPGRENRSERPERRPRGERSERGESMDRGERPRGQRSDRFERTERPGRGARPEREERPRREQSNRPGRPTRSNEAERPRSRTRPDDASKPPRARRPGARPSGQPGRPKRPGSGNKPKRGADR